MSNLLAYFKPVGKSSPQGSTSNGNTRKRPRSLVVDSDSEEEAEVKKVHIIYNIIYYTMTHLAEVKGW